MEFFVCFDEFYKMAKKHDGVKKIVVHFFLKSVIRTSDSKFSNPALDLQRSMKFSSNFRNSSYQKSSSIFLSDVCQLGHLLVRKGFLAILSRSGQIFLPRFHCTSENLRVAEK